MSYKPKVVQIKNFEEFKLVPILYNGKLVNHLKFSFFWDEVSKSFVKELCNEGEEINFVTKIRNNEIWKLNRKELISKFGEKFIYSFIDCDGDIRFFTTGRIIHKKINEFDLGDIGKTFILYTCVKNSYSAFPDYSPSYIVEETSCNNYDLTEQQPFLDEYLKPDHNILKERLPESYSQVIRSIRNEKLDTILNG